MLEYFAAFFKIHMFKKILIANRGEIAVRIMRACREMGIRAVAVFSEADRASLHVRLADEAYRHRPRALARKLSAHRQNDGRRARDAGCDALHPGYGFLAENPALARACAEAGITFIGPSPEAMEQLGSKTAARQLAQRCRRAHGARHAAIPSSTDADARTARAGIGYPVLLKAVAGGGGKGMRLVAARSRTCCRLARRGFGSAERLWRRAPVPRKISRPAAPHRNSDFRRRARQHRPSGRARMFRAAPPPESDRGIAFAHHDARSCGAPWAKRPCACARAAGYTNAGTVEFLVDAQRNFYFLEVNTRLQVEHPVTEMVTGLDLVKLQIRVAAGEPLPFRAGGYRAARPRHRVPHLRRRSGQ